MKLKSTLFLLILCALQSCELDIEKVKRDSERIRSLVHNNCNCEEVYILQYRVRDTATIVSCQILKSKAVSKEEESKRIMKLLSDSIPNFCKIDHFHLSFADKIMSEDAYTRHYRKCKFAKIIITKPTKWF